MGIISHIEETSMKAWPALYNLYFNGWIIQMANGLNYRTNCVNPLYGNPYKLEKKIKYCEKVYSKHNLPTVFKITPTAHKYNLDKTLEKLRYQRIFDISVQTMELNNYPDCVDRNISFFNNSIDLWCASFLKFSKTDVKHNETLKSIINKVKYPKCLMGILSNERIIGCGLGIITNENLWLFEIAICKKHRGTGLGKEIVTNLLIWGKTNGAKNAYLQVLKNNTIACNLYSSLGFREIYQYWYRIKSND